MALIGAIAVEWLHQTSGWRVVRMIAGTLALLTLYVQVLSNFVRYAPDASEAGWNRHANVLWGELATTVQTRLYSGLATEGIKPQNATVYFYDDFYDDAAALRWYLRDLRPVSDPASASVLVGTAPAKAAIAGVKPRQFHFAYAETWPFDWSGLTPAKALLYIFIGDAWAAPAASEVTITVLGAPSFASEPEAPVD
jgi:hypothetical protein